MKLKITMTFMFVMSVWYTVCKLLAVSSLKKPIGTFKYDKASIILWGSLEWLLLSYFITWDIPKGGEDREIRYIDWTIASFLVVLLQGAYH